MCSLGGTELGTGRGRVPPHSGEGTQVGTNIRGHPLEVFASGQLDDGIVVGDRTRVGLVVGISECPGLWMAGPCRPQGNRVLFNVLRMMRRRR